MCCDALLCIRYFIIQSIVHNVKDMDLCIHGSATGTGAAARAAAGAATVCTYYVIIRSLYLHDMVHTVASEAAAPAAAPAAALAAAPAADPWIHGSISFIMNHIFYHEMMNTCMFLVSTVLPGIATCLMGLGL